MLLYELIAAINLYTSTAVRFIYVANRIRYICVGFFPTTCRGELVTRTLYIFLETIKMFVFFNNSTTHECDKNKFLKGQ